MPDWIFCHQVLEAQQPETALDHLRAHGTAAEAQLLQDCSSAYNPGVLLNSSVVVFLFLFCLFFSLSPLNLYKMKWRVFSFSTELLYRVWRSVGKLTPSRLFFLNFLFFLSMQVFVWLWKFLVECLAISQRRLYTLMVWSARVCVRGTLGGIGAWSAPVV